MPIGEPLPNGHVPGAVSDVGVDMQIYRITIKGRIGARLQDVFAPLTARVVAGASVLEGPIEDQAALHGVLCAIQSLGLELLEVKRVAS